MIKIMCQTSDVIKLGQLAPFQGDLKHRTSKDIKTLIESLKNDGLLMPFAVWQHDDINSLLDGHSRFIALTEIALTDGDVATQDFPVIYIQADTEEQAKKSLLQITSSYGKITKEGAIKFCATIPEYHAPAINKFVYKKTIANRFKPQNMEQVIRIAVPNDKAQAVLNLFKSVDYIRVL